MLPCYMFDLPIVIVIFGGGLSILSHHTVNDKRQLKKTGYLFVFFFLESKRQGVIYSLNQHDSILTLYINTVFMNLSYSYIQLVCYCPFPTKMNASLTCTLLMQKDALTTVYS